MHTVLIVFLGSIVYTICGWAFAEVVTHKYPHPKQVKGLIYFYLIYGVLLMTWPLWMVYLITAKVVAKMLA